MKERKLIERWENYNDLPLDVQKRIAEDWTQGEIENGFYYECYIKPCYEEELDEIQKEIGLDFEIVYDCGASYIYIKTIKVRDYTTEYNGLRYDITTDYSRTRGGVPLLQVEIIRECDEEMDNEIENAIMTQENARLSKLQSLCEKLFQKYYDGLLYGTDDDHLQTVYDRLKGDNDEHLYYTEDEDGVIKYHI